MAARPPPARWTRHVRPPSSVARMVPSAPTAQPCASSAKLSASSGSRVGVGETVHVRPLSDVCSTRLPGVPASQQFGPRTAIAAKSNKAAASRGKAAGGLRHCPPKSAVNRSSPASPASQAAPGATKRSWRIACRPASPGRASWKSPSRSRPSCPLRPANMPVRSLRKSPASQPSPRPPPEGVQLRPPSRVRNTPPGNIGEQLPAAQPRFASKRRICLKAGSNSRGSRCQCRPPSRVASTTPALECK